MITLNNDTLTLSTSLPPRVVQLPWRAVLLPAAVTACAALPLLERIGVLQLVAFLAVACASAWVAWGRTQATRPAPEPAPAPTRDAPAAEAPLRELLSDVLPLWLSHVAAVKGQTEDAVNELVQSFASVIKRFEAAGFEGAARATSAKPVNFGLLKLCERELTPVIASMRRILDGKGTLVASISSLAEATVELRGMADEVRQIAAQTSILAINAAIEAAHAGDKGRGFSVIAKEIRTLSQTSEQSAKRIAERMDGVEQLMRRTVSAADQAAEHDRVVIELSGEVIGDVLDHVRALGDSSDAMRAHANVIRDETENLLVNLQFQDRVSQIITVIDDDMRRLQQVLPGPADEIPTAQTWIARMEGSYTMNDQRVALVGAQPGAPADAPSDDEVVFF